MRGDWSRVSMGRSSEKTRPSQDLFRLRQEHSKRTSSSSYGHRCRDRFAPSVAHEREETEAEIRGRRTRKRRLCRDETDRELCGLTHTHTPSLSLSLHALGLKQIALLAVQWGTGELLSQLHHFLPSPTIFSCRISLFGCLFL